MIKYVTNCKECNWNKFVFKQRGVHVGLYCAHCGKWIKWVSKQEQTRYSIVNGTKFIDCEDE